MSTSTSDVSGILPSSQKYIYKEYGINRHSAVGVFHIYLPKAFFQYLKKKTSSEDVTSVVTSSSSTRQKKYFLEGQIGSAPAVCSPKSNTSSVVVCSISGLLIFSGDDDDIKGDTKKNGPQSKTSTMKKKDRKRSSRLNTTRSKMKTVEADPNIIGELLIGHGSMPSSQRPPGYSTRFWMTLEIDVQDIQMTSKEEIYFPVGVRSIKRNEEMIARQPQAENVVWMYYDPKEVKYVQKQQILNSGVPQVVLDGIAQDIPYCPVDMKKGWERIPLLKKKSFLPKFLGNKSSSSSSVPFSRSAYLGGYDGDYFETKGDTSFLKIRSAGVDQFLYKLYLFKGLATGKYGLDLCLINLLTILVLDFIIGYYFTSYLLTLPSLYSILHSKIGELLEALLRLLNWLRGSPAGLKLNAELNSLLWRFFSYHLHLWRNYIGILEPVLSILLSTVIHAGAIGFTLQVSLIQDLLSMATFHVYCLYIYASRLFSVQQVIVKSLGRLFMGRKWNPLRGRVDHVRLTKLEMFLGSLAFTIGIFLFPTTLVYYTVFLSLRLPVLIIESVLAYFVSLFNTTRLITTFLILTNSPRVCDVIFLIPILENSDSNIHNETEPNIRFLIRVQNTKSIWRFPRLGHITKILKDILQGTVLN